MPEKKEKEKKKAKETEKEFSRAELAEKGGTGNKPVYVAYDGKVYDVSDSSLWEGGRHMDLHEAGRDLTSEFEDAPHGKEVFERFPQVGALEKEAEAEAGTEGKPPESGAREFWRRVLKRAPILRRHPHPMVVHFPIVFMISTTAFTVLYFLTGMRSFEVTGFHCLAGGLLFTPVALATGLFTWWLNYEARLFRPAVIKMILTPILLAVAAAAFVWRLLEPEILTRLGHWTGMVYLALLCSLTPLVSVIGWFGAAITFPLPEE